jgi:hypothetical protein
MANKFAINFFCDGFCTASPHVIHVTKNSDVSLVAIGTNVTLTFVGTVSPFKSGDLVIAIPADTIKTEKVGTKADTFKYKLKCSSCPTQQDDASMIVDLG